MFKALVQKFFSYQYLFGAPTTSVARTDFGIYYCGVTLFAIGIILFFITRTVKMPLRKHLLTRWTRLTFWIGALLAIWFWLRYELVNFFALHIVPVVIVVIGIVWLVYILKYQFGKYRLQLAEFEKELIKKKYM